MQQKIQTIFNVLIFARNKILIIMYIIYIIKNKIVSVLPDTVVELQQKVFSCDNFTNKTLVKWRISWEQWLQERWTADSLQKSNRGYTEITWFCILITLPITYFTFLFRTRTRTRYHVSQFLSAHVYVRSYPHSCESADGGTQCLYFPSVNDNGKHKFFICER